MPTPTARLSQTDHRALTWWAAGVAERVLDVFEAVRPDDARPREAIEAARAWARGEIPMMDARCFAFAAHDAARDVDGHARAAARAAGHAFATAHMPRHAGVVVRYACAAVDDVAAEHAFQRESWPAFEQPALAIQLTASARSASGIGAA